VDFVGSQNHGIRPETAPDWYDWNCEAYPGWTIPRIAEKVEAAMTACDPDILLVHVGTNGKDWEDKPGQIASLLDRVNAYALSRDHPVTVLLCQIINRFAGENQTPTTRFNQEVARMVKARSGDRIRIVLVDMEHGAGLDYSDRLPDHDPTLPDEGGDMLGTRYLGVPLDRYHPNDKGNAKMARKFHQELVELLGQPPRPEPGATKETTP
jgi:lysophospholipase L1-like esterase